MNQFLSKDDGKWHITMFVDIPRVLIRNHLNFRIYSSTSHSGVVTRDPSILNSNYIFNITPNLLGRKVFFNVSFSKASIANIGMFRFGLCDESIGWHHTTFVDIKNEYKSEVITVVSEPRRSSPVPMPIVEPVILAAPVVQPVVQSIIDPVIEELKTEPEPEAIIDLPIISEPMLQEALQPIITEKASKPEDVVKPIEELLIIPESITIPVTSERKTYQKKPKRK